MPTYEYACSACNHQWEEIQKISEPALEICPSCAKATAKRQISGGNFILKGGGWYADLYSSSSNKKPNGDTAKADGGAKSADTVKGDGGGSGGSKESGSNGAKESTKPSSGDAKSASTSPSTPPKT